MLEAEGADTRRAHEEDVYQFFSQSDGTFWVVDDSYQTTFDRHKFFIPCDPDKLQSLIDDHKEAHGLH
ncbi:MAG: hypothetical protein GF350_01790 [Chitinivibrionales bacterium]|nr:hypothetical protein [Chitinivibrionales bacterium]